MPSVETVLLIVSVLFALSILASKASVRIGVPALLLFAGLGMLAGSDGPGGIYFDNPWATQLVGVLALVMILFAAGFETDLRNVRATLPYGASLATVAVVASALLVAVFADRFLGVSFAEGLLLGAVVSSTDAAAVFNALRGRDVSLPPRLQQIIELESGGNDPMAALLTVVMIGVLRQPDVSAGGIALQLALQLAVGAAAGYGLGKLTVLVINRVRLEWEGLYPVLSLTAALFTYGMATVAHGNGFLAVYGAGLAAGAATLIHRNTLRVFHDGMAWLMQIAMFLVLGLQVYPSRLPDVAGEGMAVALFLIFVARPVSVFVALPTRAISVREKLFIAWVGLRGAAPIILATFPLLAGVERAHAFFDVVFFVALTSLLVQGTTVRLAARLLRVQVPAVRSRAFPVQFNPTELSDGRMLELRVAPGAFADGRRVLDLQLPPGVLIVLTGRNNQFAVPQGGTVLRAGDSVSVLTGWGTADAVREKFEGEYFTET